MADEIKTTNDLRRAYPALVSEIEEAAAKDAREQERQRIQDIEEMSLPGSEAMTTEAKFTKPMSAADYAKAVVKNAKQQGAGLSGGRGQGRGRRGMSGVEGEPGGGEKPDEFLDALKAMGKEAAVRKERGRYEHGFGEEDLFHPARLPDRGHRGDRDGHQGGGQLRP